MRRTDRSEKLTEFRTSATPAGVVALMSVIIVGAMLLLVGISVAYIGQTEIILAGDADREQEVRYTAVACGEEALFRLKKDSAYVGGSVVVVGGNTCSVTVAGAGNTRTIVSTTTIFGYTKTLNLAVSLRTNVSGNAKGWHVDAYLEVDP